MTMIPVILSSELLPKMRHGFTTLTQSQKCRPWLTPPTKFKRAHLAGKVMTSIFWNSQGVIIIDYLEQVRTINGAYYEGDLRRLRQEIARKRRGKLTRGVLLLQDNTPAQNVTICHDCCDWMWIWNPSSSAIFSWYGFFWLLSVPKTEIPSSWHTIWKQCRRHGGSIRVLGGPGKGLLFWRYKKAWTEMGLVHCLEGRLYWKVMVKFLFSGSPKYKGPWTFWSSLVSVRNNVCL